jgi:PilZ domain
MSELSDRAHGQVTPFPGGHQGKLTTLAGEQVPVRAYARGPDVAMLVLLLDVGDQLDGEQLEPALLEYASARGMVKVRGQAVLQERDLVRFNAVGDPEVLQRRDYVRVRAPQVVTLTADLVGEPLSTYAVDLSGGGMLLTAAQGLKPGAQVRFGIDLNDQEAPIEGSGRVVRISDDGELALVFEQISTIERQRLIRFVFECMRAARAKTRGDAQ